MLLDEIAMSETATSHLTTLLNFLISSYFLQLKTVLIVHNSSQHSILQSAYLDGVQLAFHNQSVFVVDHLPALLWRDVGALYQNQFDEQMLRSVDFAIEGFITILPYTPPFLHARYYATRNSKLRLKDKLYLFLCEEHENPTDFLATEILQFYPHHVMVRPQPIQCKGNTTGWKNFTAKGNVNINGDLKVAASRVLKPTALEAVKKSTTSSSKLRDVNFEMWTQKFVGAVGNLDAVQLDAFLPNETFARNVELYPNKLWDLKGRTLKVGSLTYIPYAVTNYVPAGTGNTDPLYPHELDLSISWLGSEPVLMKTFCEIRNCHLRVKPYGPDNWGVINENGTSSGMLGGIYRQHVEFAIGCIYNWYDNLTETSHTIARSSVTLLGPAPALVPLWYTNLAPFSSQLWLLLVLTIIVCVFTLCLIKIVLLKIENFELVHQKRVQHLHLLRYSSLKILAIFLQQPSGSSSHKGFSMRIFFALLLSAAITLENIYSGQLKSILTVPQYSEPVDTYEKWVKTNWKWAAPSTAWVDTIRLSTLPKDIAIKNRFHIYDYNKLYKTSFRGDYGLAIERLESGTFSFGKYITKKAVYKKIVLKDNLFHDFTHGVSIRGSPLMTLFNKHVRTCTESGLFQQWERRSVDQFLDSQTQQMLINTVLEIKSKSPPKVLSIENITGALFCLAFGYVSAGIALLLEIFEPVLRKKFIKIKFWAIRQKLFLHFYEK